MDALGKRLVTALIKSEDVSLLSKHALDRTDLTSDARVTFDWVIDYFREYGSWPDLEMVRESTGIELPEEEKPAAYIANLVRERSLGTKISRTVESVIGLIEDRKPDAALELMSHGSLAMRTKSKAESPVSFRESGEDRIKLYDDLKAVDGLLGMPTPWPRLNANIQGWCDGTLNVITAMMNTGKTWWLIYCANHAFSQGKKVLFVSLEMDIPRIQRRADAIRYAVPVGRLRGCDMDADLEESWKSRVRADSTGEGDILFADKKMVRTVADVNFLVYDYKPDIVFIDGGYRFTVAGGGTSGEWANTVSIVGDLQIAAEITNIPWIVSTQQGDANETGKRAKSEKKMHAWGIRYGKEWVINPDNVIGLYADDDLRSMKCLEMHQLKTRDATGDAMYSEIPISWDLGTMEFGEMSPLGDFSEDTTEDTLFGSHEVRLVDD